MSFASALTWKDVAAPNLAPSMEGIRIAGNQLDKAFSGLSEGLGKFDEWRHNQAAAALMGNAMQHQDAASLKKAMADGTIFAGIPKDLLTPEALKSLDTRAGTLLSQSVSQEQLNHDIQANPERLKALQDTNALNAKTFDARVKQARQQADLTEQQVVKAKAGNEDDADKVRVDKEANDLLERLVIGKTLTGADAEDAINNSGEKADIVAAALKKFRENPNLVPGSGGLGSITPGGAKTVPGAAPVAGAGGYNPADAVGLLKVAAAGGAAGRTLGMSDSERDLAIRLLKGEAGGESPEGQAGVMHVVRNRALSGKFGDGTLGGVIMQPLNGKPGYQFSLWNAGDPAGVKARALSKDSEEYKRLGAIVDGVMSGDIADPTGGAANYYNPRNASPSWGPVLAKDNDTVIGNHRFVGREGVATPMETINLDELREAKSNLGIRSASAISKASRYAEQQTAGDVSYKKAMADERDIDDVVSGMRTKVGGSFGPSTEKSNDAVRSDELKAKVQKAIDIAAQKYSYTLRPALAGAIISKVASASNGIIGRNTGMKSDLQVSDDQIDAEVARIASGDAQKAEDNAEAAGAAKSKAEGLSAQLEKDWENFIQVSALSKRRHGAGGDTVREYRDKYLATKKLLEEAVGKVEGYKDFKSNVAEANLDEKRRKKVLSMQMLEEAARQGMSPMSLLGF